LTGQFINSKGQPGEFVEANLQYPISLRESAEPQDMILQLSSLLNTEQSLRMSFHRKEQEIVEA
jgi:hypothetical protein